MKKTEDYCSRCEDETEQIMMGFVPLEMVVDSTGDEWVNINHCLSCDSIIIKPIEESRLKKAEERYLHGLVQHDVISEQEARETLGLD